MTADIRPDLIEAMAKAGYETMIAAYWQREPIKDDLNNHTWEKQDELVREDWRTTTKAMLKAMLTVCYTGGHADDY